MGKQTASATTLMPDPVYGSELASKFINCLMHQGRKTAARKVFYEAIDSLQTKIPGKEPMEVFSEALNNIKPVVEVRSRRVGGATLQVPHEIKRERQQALAVRWIIDAARAKKGKPMGRRLAEELFDAFNRQGAAWTVRENTHKMAEANKAYAHFAW